MPLANASRAPWLRGSTVLLLAVVSGLAACDPNNLSGVHDPDTVPPFKGNDTGGIIAYPLTGQIDIRALAINHCASYGKVVKFLAVEAHYGGYISFSCRWLPYAAVDRPLRARY